MYDSVEFLRLIRRAEKRDAYARAGEKLKIAVLGTNSIQHVVKGVRYLLYERYGVGGVFYEGGYDGIAGELMDEASEYYAFRPEVTVLLPDSGVTDVELYQSFWKRMPGYILQANFVTPNVTALGNLEANVDFSRTYQIESANLKLARVKPANVAILNFNGLASRVGTDRWFDYPAYFSTKQGFSTDFLPEVCDLIVRQIGALMGRVRKCLVLDLDNTLWGGVVGDDGCDGIKLDPNDPVGEAYRFFQKYLLELKARGVILAVCSKNEQNIAEEPFDKNENMLLKRSDIACFVANWRDKATNLRAIARELNIGTDSLVFFDDNPAEREIVRMNLPEVLVVDVPPDPAYYAKALSDAGAFDWLQITKEDMSRSASYQSNQKRERLLQQSVDYEAYLAALEMRYDIGFLDAKRIPRFAQLINKSNQFNLRTKRYTERQIEDMLADPAYRLIYAELTDRFDHYGLISCVILKDNFIDTWVMSCRVLKRRVENKMFDFILRHTQGPLRAEYLPTSKNKMVENLYPELGFHAAKTKGEYIYERI